MNNTDQTCRFCGNTFVHKRGHLPHDNGFCSGSCRTDYDKRPPSRFTVLETGRWIDVSADDVSKETRDFFRECGCAYEDYDEDNSEDLYAIHTISESAEITACNKRGLESETFATVKALADIATQHGAAYVRFIRS